MKPPKSLSQRLARYVVLGLTLVWFLALVATALVLRSEQEELADKTIRETARLFLPALARSYLEQRQDGAQPPVLLPSGPRSVTQEDDEDDAEALVYRLLDRDGSVLLQSFLPGDTEFPGGPATGFSKSRTHVFYTTRPDANGFVLQLGDWREERFEAYRDSFLALLVPMLAILPLAYLMVGWIGRAALAPLDRLRHEIGARGDGRLDPIDAADQAPELHAITTTLNGFMIRLSQAIEGERAFATNAAHELRTPVAVALAQVQRLNNTAPAEMREDIAPIEASLKRMARLVARLLQLARAEAGVGLADTPQEVTRLLDVILEDTRRDPSRADRLTAHLPRDTVCARIDPDAFAIIIGNLIDNAYQHAPPDTEVVVTLHRDGHVTVTNDCAVRDAQEIATLTARFKRDATSGGGFGLGLYIADTMARQSGGSLDLRSPAGGRASGFEARFELPG